MSAVFLYLFWGSVICEPVLAGAADTTVSVSDDQLILNVGTAAGALARASQRIASVSSSQTHIKGVQLDVSLRGAVNVAAGLASRSDAVQDIGVIDSRHATGNVLSLDLKHRVSNAAASLAASAAARQEIGVISGQITEKSEIDISAGGLLTNVSAGLAARADAAQIIGKISVDARTGNASDNELHVILGRNVTNAGIGILGAGRAFQTIGMIDGAERASGNKLALDFKKQVTNMGDGVAGAGTATQEIGFIKGDVIDNTVTITAKEQIKNVAAGTLGRGKSTQIVGEIDASRTKASKNRVNLTMDGITGAGRGLAGSGSVKQRIGVLSAGGHDNAIFIASGKITASGTGALGQGASIENIGRIDTADASHVYLDITTGDISTSAVGMDSTSEIDIGWISGSPAGGVDADIRVGNIDNRLLGVNASSVIQVGDVSGKVDGHTTIRIAAGDLSVDVKAGFNAKDNDLGIWIGNVKGPVHGNAKVAVKTNDIKHHSVTAFGCLGSACLSNAFYGYSKIKVGNIGMGEDEYVGNYARQLKECIENPGKHCLKEIFSDIASVAEAVCSNFPVCRDAQDAWNACPVCPGSFDPVYWLKYVYL